MVRKKRWSPYEQKSIDPVDNFYGGSEKSLLESIIREKRLTEDQLTAVRNEFQRCKKSASDPHQCDHLYDQIKILSNDIAEKFAKLNELIEAINKQKSGMKPGDHKIVGESEPAAQDDAENDEDLERRRIFFKKTVIKFGRDGEKDDGSEEKKNGTTEEPKQIPGTLVKIQTKTPPNLESPATNAPSSHSLPSSAGNKPAIILESKSHKEEPEAPKDNDPVRPFMDDVFSDVEDEAEPEQEVHMPTEEPKKIPGTQTKTETSANLSALSPLTSAPTKPAILTESKNRTEEPEAPKKHDPLSELIDGVMSDIEDEVTTSNAISTTAKIPAQTSSTPAPLKNQTSVVGSAVVATAKSAALETTTETCPASDSTTDLPRDLKIPPKFSEDLEKHHPTSKTQNLRENIGQISEDFIAKRQGLSDGLFERDNNADTCKIVTVMLFYRNC